MEKCRIDKWLWFVRVFKTRTLAADACGNGKVLMEGVRVKSSREIKPGDIVSVKTGYMERKFEVKALPPSRVSASLVKDYAEDITPLELKEQWRIIDSGIFEKRDRGSGRPTKKDRREIERFKENY